MHAPPFPLTTHRVGSHQSRLAGDARCYAQGMPRQELPPARRSPATRVTFLILLVVLLFGTRSFAAYAIEIEWWKELGQLNTWLSMLYYSIAPVAAATLLAFAALWISHARALKFAGTRLGEHPLYARISALALLALGW